MDYHLEDNAYYSRLITKDDGFKSNGSINIISKDDKYYIEFIYNYAKIETLVSKDDINDTVLNAAYILSTVKYNADIIELMLNEDYFTSREERYILFDK